MMRIELMSQLNMEYREYLIGIVQVTIDDVELICYEIV